jgi:Leucine-rich repeat (LRR) protein
MVTIPDENFAQFLKEKYPTCFIGNQLDITNSLITKEDSLSIDSLYIQNYSGLEYFKNLTFLDCSNNPASSLPKLSIHLKSLNCSQNFLTKLPKLDHHLVYLNCSANQLTELPELNDNLTYLNVGYNKLNKLPVLPKKIQILLVNDNTLSEFPLSQSLKEINCSNNLILFIVFLFILYIKLYQNWFCVIPLLFKLNIKYNFLTK